VPVLFLYTGVHAEYHKPTDVPEKIDVPGMKKVADFTEKLADDVLVRETKPKYIVVREPYSDPTDPTPRGPLGPRLGIAPGNYGDNNGVLVDSVSPGGVAEKAGVQAGDFIVEIAGKPTPNIQAYMGAMSGQKPGTTIDVVVERKGKKLTLKAELK
jgi:S1-C subfamily serine protease